MQNPSIIYGYARVSTGAQDLTGQLAPAQGGGMPDGVPGEDHRHDSGALVAGLLSGRQRRETL
jgi:hypothetical protein